MQQLELSPELDTNPHTVVFTFKGVDYVTEPAEMETVWGDDEPRATCNGCAFFSEEWIRTDEGCQQSEEVCSCTDHKIIWVKKG